LVESNIAIDEISTNTIDTMKIIEDNISLSNFLLKEKMDYDSSIVVLNSSLLIIENFELNDSIKAIIYHNLGVSHLRKYNIKEADNNLNKALSLRKNYFSENSLDYAASLEALGHLFFITREFPIATRYFKNVLSIREKLLNEDHPDIAQSYHTIGGMSHQEGDFKKAEYYYLKAIKIMENVPNKENTFLSSLYIDLASVYKEIDEFDKEELLYNKAINLLEKTNNEFINNLAFAYNGMGTLLNRRDKKNEAIPYFEKSIKLKRQLLGDNHPSLIPSLCNLGDAYYEVLNDYKTADSLYLNALNIANENFYEYHPFVSRILEQYADLALWGIDTSKAITLIDKAYNSKLNYLSKIGFYQTESEALNYSQSLKETVDHFHSILISTGLKNPDYQKKSIEIALNTKGNVSDIIFKQRKSYFNETDKEITDLFETFKKEKTKLSEIYMRGTRDKNTDSLYSIINKIESDLAFRSASFRQQLNYSYIEVEDIVQKLPANSILLEFFKVNYIDNDKDTLIPTYLLTVINNEGKYDVIQLSDASDIDNLIIKYKDNIHQMSQLSHNPLKKDNAAFNLIGKELYNILIKPVESYITNNQLIFIAPDGGINLVSFASLVNNENKYLIEKNQIHYLSAGRDLINSQDDNNLKKGFLLVGDPNFDSLPNMNAEYSVLDIKTGDNNRLFRGNIRNIDVKPIPGTRNEIENISSICKKFSNEHISKFMGNMASEDNFKKYAPDNRILHLATHGFYLRDSEDTLSTNDHPLLHSGLFLAGVNQRNKLVDSLGLNDGILTAYEICELNLEGTELATLSACETGLGDIQEGEGVYGLRRAFHIAGVKTVISALWPVSDKSTSVMMSKLFDKSNLTIPEKMQLLQINHIKELRDNGFTDHPYLWAGFIASGAIN